LLFLFLPKTSNLKKLILSKKHQKNIKKRSFLDKKGAFRLFIAKKSQKLGFYKFIKQLFFKLPILFAKK
jgi:hypothetical protein